MAKCAICDKGAHFGIAVSHSHRRSSRTWKPNLRTVKTEVDGTPTKLHVCARCLKTLRKEDYKTSRTTLILPIQVYL